VLLYTPGPVPVPEFARVAMSALTIHHRTSEFEDIFKQTRNKLLGLFNFKEVVMLASSGSGAMESSVVNFCDKKCLVIVAGKFGERFSDIAKKYNKQLIELTYSWDTPAKVSDIEKKLNKDKDIDSIFIQFCDSSGGLEHPIADIAKAVKKINPNINIIVDGITAVCVTKIDDSNIDVLIAGSQKAFMLPPGLSMLWLSEQAIKVIELNKQKTAHYFDLGMELKSQKKNTTAFTPATTLIIGLNAILDAFLSKNINNIYLDTNLRAKAMTKAIKSIGLEIYPKAPSNAMIVVSHPQANKFKEILKNKFKISVAGGQGDIKNTIFRINNMGLIEVNELSYILNAIELILEEMNIRKFDGKASCEFLKEYFNTN
jgi:aspartate aminotransferase-like enzyme